MKWTIEMSNKELARKTEIERVLDQRITQKEAAKRLWMSERQFKGILDNIGRMAKGLMVTFGLRTFLIGFGLCGSTSSQYQFRKALIVR